MTEQEYKQAKQIVQLSPDLKHNDGINYYSSESEKYYELHDYFWYEVDDYTMTLIKTPEYFIRALSDLKTQIAQYEEIQELKARVAELEQENEEFEQQNAELTEAIEHSGIDADELLEALREQNDE